MNYTATAVYIRKFTSIATMTSTKGEASHKFLWLGTAAPYMGNHQIYIQHHYDAGNNLHGEFHSKIVVPN